MYEFDPENNIFVFASAPTPGSYYSDNVLVSMNQTSFQPMWFKEIKSLDNIAVGNLLGNSSVVITLSFSNLEYYSIK